MKIYFNGWFSGFFDKTNPGIHVGFFITVFEHVYNETCVVGTLNDSDVLCEFDMLIGCNTEVKTRGWKQSYLFSGESTLKCNKNDYTCVLWGERNHKNVINLPLFIAYMYSNNLLGLLESKSQIQYVPKYDVCVIVSNPNGHIRTKFLNLLESEFNVCYAGRYKNNMGRILPYEYNTIEYRNFVSQFKFVVSMENSKEDTYITEKIVNGLLANVIPVYWGSSQIHNYINRERILCLEDERKDSMKKIIHTMKEIKNDDNRWIEIVNKPVFSNIENTLERTITMIAKNIKALINTRQWNSITNVYCVSNPEFEPDRCNDLKELFKQQSIDENHISYISPTYKHTITSQIYHDNINIQLVYNLRKTPMKQGELSLFLNYKAILEDIEKNYKDGNFLILESDVLCGKDINMFDEFISKIKDKDWDLIHVGMYDNRIWKNPNFPYPTGYSTNRMFYNNNNYIEDITLETDKFRLSRKFYTRCTDSFLWTYSGIIKFLQYMNTETNYGVPFDYYMCNFFEKNTRFKHYWSEHEFFKQGSNLNLVKSTIQ